MSDVTTLLLWPSGEDALHWSQDGIMALASDEQVELLFPNNESEDSDNELSKWQHITLQMPWFSHKELPVKQPAPRQTFSVGEEISSSCTIDIAWSPAGIAKHRKCALAALTSNLVLSIWSSDGNLEEVLHWKRRLIINDALKEYCKTNPAAEESHITDNEAEQQRLQKRIRAFAWAPTMYATPLSSTCGTRLAYGQQLLAVSDDDNRVVFLIVESPTSTLGVEKRWVAEVLSSFSTTPEIETVFSDPILFDDLLRQQRHVSHLAWSPWTIRGEWYHSVIAYTTNDDVRARVITYWRDTIGFGPEIVYPDIDSVRFAGPIKWSPEVEDNDTLRLAVFTRTQLICLSISASDGSILSRYPHDLEDRCWDPVSGVVWDRASQSLRLQFSLVDSTTECSTTAVELSPTGLEVLPSQNWKEQIGNNETLFSAQYELKGNSTAKVWGLATSPMGDFIASCHTLHPTDMLEYGAPQNRQTTITVNTLRPFRSYQLSSEARAPNQLSFSKGEVTAEGLVFTIRKWLDNIVEETGHIPAFQKELLATLLQTYVSTPNTSSTTGTLASTSLSQDLESLVVAFKHQAFLDPHSLRDRFEIMISTVCDPQASWALPRALIAFRLAQHIQNLPAILSQAGDFSSDILSQSHQVTNLIFQIINQTSPATEVAPGTEVTTQPLPTSPISYQETCDFCAADIPFTDVETATCARGHQFVRCGLSFLAIQAPRITKYCGICNTPFLSEDFVAAQEGETDSETAAQEPATKNQAHGSGHGEDTEMPDRPDENGTGGAKAPAEKDGPNGQVEIRNGTFRGVVQGESMDWATPKVDGPPEDVAVNGEGDGEEDGGRIEVPLTLARVLFLGCDACVYCGGKFTG